MSDARRLVMTRDQVEKVTGDNHQRIKEFEKLLNALSSDPVEPITVAITGNTTYTLANERGTQTILIPEAMLKASAGGPFTLTITTGVGDSVIVPIGASTDTIMSGDLLFDIYIDSSGNVISKDWSVYGSTTTGQYVKRSNGGLDQHGSSVWSMVADVFALYTVTFPVPFIDTTYSFTANVVNTGLGGGYHSFYNSTNMTAKSTTQIGQGIFQETAGVATRTGLSDWSVSGRWR